MAVTVTVAVAYDADLYESTAPDHRDGVGIVVAEVEVLRVHMRKHLKASKLRP